MTFSMLSDAMFNDVKWASPMTSQVNSAVFLFFFFFFFNSLQIVDWYNSTEMNIEKKKKLFKKKIYLQHL